MREPSKNFNPLFTPTEVEKMGLTWLVAAGIVTAFLWQIPMGNYILYPFSILATWFHEMGHGLMALILGGQFQKLEIFGNGSGVAHYTLSNGWGYLGIGLVAAAGPMGPPLAGAGLILASGSLKTTSLSLKILGGFLLLSTLIWVRSWFGFVAIPLLGFMILGIALKTPLWVQGFAIQFLGVQACVSTYHQVVYLLCYNAFALVLSDSGTMKQFLFFRYLFWVLLMEIASLMILIQSLRVVHTQKSAK
ncbi:MAG: M50 family metallopeptidase [Dolichospermum sp.]